jgi:acetolactate synthase-1/2/3 large subunit
MYNTATAFLEALRETGVSHLFANLGSDRQALIESLAEARRGRRVCAAPHHLSQ